MRGIIVLMMLCGSLLVGCKNKGTPPKELQSNDLLSDSVEVLSEEDSLDDPCAGLTEETTMEELFPDGLLDVEICLMENYPNADWKNRQEWKYGVKSMWKWHEEVRKKIDEYLESSLGKTTPLDIKEDEVVLKKLEDGYDDYSCCGALSVTAQGWAIIADYRLIDLYKNIISHTDNSVLRRTYYDDFCFWEAIARQWVADWKEKALKEQHYYTLFPVECFLIEKAVREWRASFLQEEDAFLQGKKLSSQLKSTEKTDAVSRIAKEWYQYRKRVVTQLDDKDAAWFDRMTEKIIHKYVKDDFFPETDNL